MKPLARRLVTIPATLLVWGAWLVAAPLWVPLAAIVDAARRSGGVALRSGAMLLFYLSCELLGIALSSALWVWGKVLRVERARWQDVHFRLQAWWAATLLAGAMRLFGMRLAVEGDGALDRGPYLLLLRHASTGDTLLASALVSRPHGIRLRYVLKQELLLDPCLDLVGNRLPNVFVDRFSADSGDEVARIRELARDLGPRDGVLIYPEGTRFSEAKRRRIIERFEAKGDAKARELASSLYGVLPPRPGGTLALLAAAPDADVVVCAHTGFEGAASLGRIWNGALLGQTIRVRFWRIPRSEVPTGGDARLAWLLDEWRRIDAWLARHRFEEGVRAR